MRASRSRLASLPVTALALLVLGSCGGDSPTGSGSEAGPPARVELVSGENQTGTVGVELGSAVVAKVVDEAGHPVKGQLVNFRVASGGGSVFAGSSLTDAQGTARERWTLGTTSPMLWFRPDARIAAW